MGAAGAYTTTWYMMVDLVRGAGRADAWANFSIMMECSPESGYRHSVYSVVKLTGWSLTL
jgi:hypothetical protein